MILLFFQVFDHNGEFLFCFGSNGEGNGQFNAPTGLAVDAQDNILVADWGNSRIQIFDSQGSFLSFVNTVVCPLYGPQGLALTHDGHIVVADSGNHCFKLYKYLQWRPPLDPQVPPAQYVYWMFRWQFCVHMYKYMPWNLLLIKVWVTSDIQESRTWPWLGQNHIWNKSNAIVFGNRKECTLIKTISSIML